VSANRRLVLTGVTAGIGLLTAVILLDVFATVFLAMTVAYVFSPVYRWCLGKGLPPWWASAVTTTVTFLGGLSLFAPVVIILYARRSALLAILRGVPDDFSLTLFGLTATFTLEELTRLAIGYLQSLAVVFASAAPALGVKLGLFALVLFALFMGGDRVHRAAFAVVPTPYHDVAAALLRRARATLYAIYVLQALTAAGTFLVAVPVFYLLGYQYPFAMAAIAAILQFLPIIGPSLVVGAAALYHVALGQLAQAVLVVVVAGLFVAALPDLVIRPRFAKKTADLPGSLYFVGFTGGLFSLGPIGVIAGPLVVALFVESVSLLADELNHEELAAVPDLDPDEPEEWSLRDAPLDEGERPGGRPAPEDDRPPRPSDAERAEDDEEFDPVGDE